MYMYIYIYTNMYMYQSTSNYSSKVDPDMFCSCWPCQETTNIQTGVQNQASALHVVNDNSGAVGHNWTDCRRINLKLTNSTWTESTVAKDMDDGYIKGWMPC